MVPSQQDIDNMVARIRKVVEREGKGNPSLTNLQSAYTMFHKRPDAPTYGMLLGILDNMEKQGKKG